MKRSSQEFCDNELSLTSKDNKRIMLICAEKDVSLLKESLTGLNIAKTEKEEEELIFVSDISQDSYDDGNQMFGSQNSSNNSLDNDKYLGLKTRQIKNKDFETDFPRALTEEDEVFFSDEADDEGSLFLFN